MSDNEALLLDPPSPVRIEKIDLATYRTSELVERLTELISVPRSVRKILTAAFILTVLSTVACYGIHIYSEITQFTLLCLCAYSLAVGGVFGLVLGLLRIITTASGNVESILMIVMEVTGKAAADYEQIQAGTMRLPTGGELVEQVHGSVVLPVIEQTTAKTLGVLGTPLLWTYRRTVGGAIRRLAGRVNRTQTTTEAGQDLVQDAGCSPAPIAKYSETIQTYTSRASELVGNIGAKIRFYTILPMYALFFTALGLAMLPIVLVRVFLGA